MRVISGKYRGRNIMPPKDDHVRPTTDRIKETIFNVIQFKVEDARVIDLFAGSGALGIEALSRGAEQVIFVDNSMASINLISRNLERMTGNTSILRCNFKDAILRQKEKVDLVFIDAPFATPFGKEAVELVLQYDLLHKGGVIIFEHSTETPLSIDIPCDIIVKTKKMGSVTVDFLEKKYEENGDGDGNI
ncbi:MAG: 16S rRNA (guanine(966)-N(2))-methyltransferase RsmD [Clostridia bacterium]|nr:16S rRNA (guanine(966)-N(2))-methyltransferase RsmD [Clostridia bacterium]